MHYKKSISKANNVQTDTILSKETKGAREMQKKIKEEVPTDTILSNERKGEMEMKTTKLSSPFTIPATEEDEDSWICCFCGERFRGIGRNPAPLKKSGRCCPDCNIAYVFPARMRDA